MTSEPSEIMKIAFGMAEFLQEKFPGLTFQVMPGMSVEVSEAKEHTSANIIGDKYSIIITEDRISLNIASDSAIHAGPCDVSLVKTGSLRFSAVLDYSDKHAFELSDPQSIDRIVQAIESDMRGE